MVYTTPKELKRTIIVYYSQLNNYTIFYAINMLIYTLNKKIQICIKPNIPTLSQQSVRDDQIQGLIYMNINS